jgi:poly-gamma-glutamate synthesis protein (capsule biosynthesis protein)
MSKAARRLVLGLIAVLGVLACAGGAPAPASPTPSTAASSEQTVTATLAAVGDVLPHHAIKEAARARSGQSNDTDMGFDALFSDVADQLKKYDLALFNMEGPITERAYTPAAPLVFWAPPGLAGALHRAGFSVAILANNHALDQGKQGLVETLAHLRQARLAVIGAGANFAEASRGLIIEKKGIRFGVVAFTTLLNAYSRQMRRQTGEPQVLFWHGWGDAGAEVLAAIKAMRARTDVDVVVVSAHWDAEDATRPSTYTRAIAQRVIDAGADVIIGHHPHVLQPVEYHTAADGRRALVIYSLGNFVSNMCPGFYPSSTCEERLGAIAELTFSRRGRERVRLARVAFLPTWTEHEPRCPGETRAAYRCIRPILLERRIQITQQRLATADRTGAREMNAVLRGDEMRRELIRQRLQLNDQ